MEAEVRLAPGEGSLRRLMQDRGHGPFLGKAENGLAEVETAQGWHPIFVAFNQIKGESD